MDTDTLLADAKRIAAFGMRSGTIKDDALYVAIEKAEQVKAASPNGVLPWASPETTALSKAVAAATEVIAPVTLVDLNSGWDPFAAAPAAAPAAGWLAGFRQRLGQGKMQFACLIATVLLVYAAGYYTIWHGRATELVKFGLADAVEKQDLAVRKLMLPLLVARVAAPDPATIQTAELEGTDKSAVLTDPDPAAGTLETTAEEAAQLTLLLDSVDELKKVEEAIDQYQVRFNELFRDRIILRGQWLDARDHWSGQPEPGRPDVPATRKLVAERCKPEAQQTVQQAFLASTGAGLATAGSGFVELTAVRDCLFQALNLRPPLTSASDWERQRYSFEHAMTIIGTWVLPAIYGALGALVYYMRQFMNPLRRDPNGTKVIMRVSLGALAGILLAWFWTTTSVSDSLTVPNIGLGTLTFAFIIGFSIEVFFGFLDRTVQLANESVRQMGGTKS